MVTTLPPPTPTSRADEPSRRRRGLGYQPALDGLRAISVLAVLLYHADVAWIPGGFLGVEVFFVISGFLITTLLIEEWQRSGAIDRPHFWMRRARRLLPALFAVLAAVAIYTAVVVPDELARLRGDVIAALTYTTNWFLIFSEQSYFDAFGRPSPLKHLWSLAVEEQFYIVWPVVFGFAIKKVGGKAGRLFGPLVLGAIASTALMWLMYDPDGDPSRVYYGTDTRAAGILLGGALACVWMPWRSRRPAAANAGPLLEVVGAVALLGLIWFFLNTGEFDPWLYQGGFAIVSLTTVVVIAVIMHPSVRLLSGAFALPPLVLDRAALLRHLPVALAGVRLHDARRGRLRRRAAVHRQVRRHVPAGRAQLPIPRDAHPQGRPGSRQAAAARRHRRTPRCRGVDDRAGAGGRHRARHADGRDRVGPEAAAARRG